MDGNRFDALSRTFAERSSRRNAMKRLGKGGLGAALLGAVGVRQVAAQDDGDPVTCELYLVATAAIGPNRKNVYEGELQVTIDPDGSINEGSFINEDGDEFDLVGQVNGRAVNLRIDLGEDGFLSLNGTAQRDFDLCRGEAEGTFGGPEPKDLGTWIITRQKPDDNGGDGTETPVATPTQASGDDDGGDDDDDSGPSPTPCDSTGIDCGSTFVLDPDTCQCVCPAPYDKCGDSSCCFGGSVCNSDGSCNCPDGMEACNEVCTPSCPPGQYFDDNCECSAETSCGQGETLCNGQCVSLSCNDNQLFDSGSCMCVNRCSPGQDYCDGNCIDVVNDESNCGFCGNTCPAGMPCIAGSCTCPATYKYCQSSQQCISEDAEC
jgi:hypothetical protein